MLIVIKTMKIECHILDLDRVLRYMLSEFKVTSYQVDNNIIELEDLEGLSFVTSNAVSVLFQYTDK